ncbi:hypothetical protein ABZ614_24765 [Streptomyces sp. NPDC013178]|uniref:hypothetical protein n=1 Tax=Streptomyces sp. NPDC013178 TaxID=3155118 RepID=UPI003401B15A
MARALGAPPLLIDRDAETLTPARPVLWLVGVRTDTLTAVRQHAEVSTGVPTHLGLRDAGAVLKASELP